MTLNEQQKAVLSDINASLKVREFTPTPAFVRYKGTSHLGHLYHVYVEQEDFMLRRRMLLKRLDVTLQSFLWADKAQGTSSPPSHTFPLVVVSPTDIRVRLAVGDRLVGIESDIVATVNARRESLRDDPPSLSLEDALQAPRGVMFQQACKITQERGEGVRHCPFFSPCRGIMGHNRAPFQA